MSQDPSPTAARPLSFLQRLIGIVISPGETMASIAAYPRWADMLVFTTLCVALGFYLFLSTDIGQAAYVDQAVATMESFGQTVNEQMYAGIQGQARYAGIIQGVSIIFFSPVIAAVIAAVLFGIFTVLGGEARYSQVFSVVVHAGVISVLQQLFTMPVNYQRQSMTSATNLSVFLPNLAEGSFLAAFLGVIDLFWIWYVVVLAIGLGAVYRRKWTGVAGGLFVVYVLIGLIIATVKSVMGGR
jgi:Yip1 domain